MNVHHSKLKQAMQIGCYVSMLELGRVRIFWPERAVELFLPTVNDALEEMKAVQNILKTYPDYHIATATTALVTVFNGMHKQMVGTPMLPSDIWAVMEANEQQWEEPWDAEPEPKEDLTHIKGIPKKGADAYNEGVPAADCPYPEGTGEFTQWNDDWDREADKEVAKADGIGSVVTNRYRANYAEAGHPSHCGDELAILLNSICTNKAGTNLELFEAICAANDVPLAKYNRTTKGWQGRLRMTGRNLLAKRVRENGGNLMMPPNIQPEFYRLSQDWVLEATTKYKPKRGQ